MRLAGHPLHPMLVHFPIALWTAGVALDLGGVATGHDGIWCLGFGCHALGVASAAIAMLAGFLELVSIAHGDPARDAAVWHMLAMAVTWLLFLVVVTFRAVSPATAPSRWTIAVALIAWLLMVFGSWLGGRLVYGFGVGVRIADESARNRS